MVGERPYNNSNCDDAKRDVILGQPCLGIKDQQVNPLRFNPLRFNPLRFNPLRFNPLRFNPLRFNPLMKYQSAHF
jgi:hypothetical protein